MLQNSPLRRKSMYHLTLQRVITLHSKALLVKLIVAQVVKEFRRRVWCSGDALDPYSRGTRHEYRSGHLLPFHDFSQSLQVTAGTEPRIRHIRFLPSPLQFIID
jgi:hypothetical protein